MSLHATAVVHGERGVLILGPSGSGKSALALALIARARGLGAFAALVGDDRVFVREASGRLIARGAANMAGIVERRLAGLIAVRHEPAAIVRLVVDLGERQGAMAADARRQRQLDRRRGRAAASGARFRPERLRSGARGRRAIGCFDGGEPGASANFA